MILMRVLSSVALLGMSLAFLDIMIKEIRDSDNMLESIAYFLTFSSLIGGIILLIVKIWF